MPHSAIPAATDQRWDAQYGRLKTLAGRLLSRERPDHTLQPTALVHEVFLRVSRDRRADGLQRGELLVFAARAMRDILIEHARRRRRLKRGGGSRRVAMDDALALYESRAGDLIALDEALCRLEGHDAQLARVVELRFFAGLTAPETAALLGISERSVHRAWAFARTWLAREVG